MRDEDYIALAVEKTRQGIADGQHPYGAAVVLDGEVIACEHNLVLATCDPSAHAEVVALRRAAANLGRTDLKGATIYCTCEPCVMCFGAIYWAGIATIVYGADIDDKASFGLIDPGGRCEQMKRLCDTPVVIRPRVNREPCVDLFRLFLQRKS